MAEVGLAPIAELHRVSVRRGKAPESVSVLQHVSLSLAPGQLLGVAGGPGSGKTTLLRVLSGRLRPTMGSVRVFGLPSGPGHSPIGPIALLDGVATPGDRTLEAWAGCGPGIKTSDGGERARNLLRQLGLCPRCQVRVSALSSTDRKLADIARVLALRFPVVLIDEPALPHDEATMHSFLALVRKTTREEGTSALVASSSARLLAPHCDGLTCLREGRLEPFSPVPVDRSPTGDSYRIKVKGRLDPRRAAWFSGLNISPSEADTELTGRLEDPSALYGVITRLRDLGVELLSVHRCDAACSNPPVQWTA